MTTLRARNPIADLQELQRRFPLLQVVARYLPEPELSHPAP